MARPMITSRGRREREILDDLIGQRGLNAEDYVLFGVSGEGTFWPPDAEEIEETSGFVLDRRGRVFAFWLGWDQEHGVPILEEWEEVPPEPHWPQVGEYQRARTALGLPGA